MRTTLAAILRRIIKTGRLSLIDWDGTQLWFGDPNDETSKPVILRLHDRLTTLDLIRNPQLTLG
jgi:hypothetical protein